ncbi:MAG: Cache domain family protein [Rhodoferax sp.]|uniref:cache domain-containing protein n=1 Tax=Rhodoferax sp. TaxID=50421 RepID=UPI0017D9FEB5|nr:cache domain-containing protein [Rhodoferax sp.]NMM18697.1 Cache domain family protein [Rhodoferax sp.]
MKFFRTLMTLLFAGVMSVSAMAQDHGTKDEAKSLTNAALAHIKKVGNAQAFKDFTTDKANWNKKDLYVFAMDAKGVTLAHGANEKLVGKNMMELKDQNGKMFVREITDLAAAKGEGWVDYDWAHPVTKKIEGKSTYVKRIPGFDGSVSVGTYR